MIIKRCIYVLLAALSIVSAESAFPEAYPFDLQRPCPSIDAHQAGPQWSPDGSRYAFNSENSRQTTIKICDIRSSREIEIISSYGSEAAALLNDRNRQKNVNIVGFSWAPDSRHYVFVRSEKNDISKNGIYIGNIEQKISAADDPFIYDNSVASVTWVSLGEQGSGIIYMTGNDIKLVSLDTAYSVKKSGLIYSSENRKGVPVLSNDRRYLTWTEDTVLGPKLFKCEIDGAVKCRNRTRLTSDKTQYKELCPSVSPDSNYIAYYSNRDTTQDQEQGRIYTLWIVPSETGNPKKVTDHFVRGSASPVLCPSWTANKILYVAAETDETWPFYEAALAVKNNQLQIENRPLYRSVSTKGAAEYIQGRVAVADLSVSPSSNALAFSHQDFRNADGRFQMAWIDLNKPAVDQNKQIEYQEAQRRAAERKQAEKLAAERKQAEKLAAEQKEAARAEAQKQEAEKLAAERKEAAKAEAQKQETEKLAAEQKEAARVAAVKQETPITVSRNTLPESKDWGQAHIHYAGVIAKTSDFANFTEDEKKGFEEGNASRALGPNSQKELSETDNLLSRIAEFNFFRYRLKEGVDMMIVRTDSPNFFLDEFRDASMMEDLYETLKKARISSSRPANSSPISTVEWFNSLLEITDLPEKSTIRKKSEFMNKAISSLIEITDSVRKKNFAELGITDQLLIKRLNRLIFEEMYAHETPKLSERGFINVLRDEKDPSVYYVHLYDKKRPGADQEQISSVGGGSGITGRLISAVTAKTTSGPQNSSLHFLAKKEWEYFFNYKQSWFHSESSNETSMVGFVMISGMKDGVTIQAVPVKDRFRRKEERPFTKEQVRGYAMDSPYEWRLHIKP